MPCAYANNLPTGSMRWMARRGRRVPPLVPLHTVHPPPSPTPPTLPLDWQMPSTEHDTLSQLVDLVLDTGLPLHVVPPPSTLPAAAEAAYQAALLEHKTFYEALILNINSACLEGADNPFEEHAPAYDAPVHAAPLLLSRTNRPSARRSLPLGAPIRLWN